MSRADRTEQDILKARARELARPLTGERALPTSASEVASDTADRANSKAGTTRRVSGEAGANAHLDVVEFLLAHECYAIESRFVAEVFPFADITPLPCTPAFVVGIVNFRGRVLSVIDLKFFFQLPAKGLNDRNRAIVLRSGSMEFGVLVDAMRGTRWLPEDSLQDALPTLSGIREKYLKGITSDGVVVLDGGKLLADEALVVREG